jgi:hypothetical protein
MKVARLKWRLVTRLLGTGQVRRWKLHPDKTPRIIRLGAGEVHRLGPFLRFGWLPDPS